MARRYCSALPAWITVVVSQDQLSLTLTHGDLDNRDKGTLTSQKDLVIKLLAGDDKQSAGRADFQ